MNARQVIRLLERDGWIVKAQSGSHKQFIHPVKAGKVTVPDHGKREIPPGTLHSILKHRRDLNSESKKTFMREILMIVEKGRGEDLWGRVYFDDDLIVDSAPTIGALEKKMKKLLHDLHGVNPAVIKFEVALDLTAVFSEKTYLNLSVVAQKLGINRSLMAQYAAGNKFPSSERALVIENALHDLGRDLLKVKLAVKGKRVSRPGKVRKKAKSAA